jgi:hypothetical protein
MSAIENIDKSIEKMIENLAEEFGRSGILGTSDERKEQIINQIATLRASMNPQCDCKK